MGIQGRNQRNLVTRYTTNDAINTIERFQLFYIGFRDSQIDFTDEVHHVIELICNPIQNIIREILMSNHEFNTVRKNF